MATYSKDDFQRIGAAIGQGAADVEQYKNEFEAAAMSWR
jgi:hypothetical protein